MTEAERRERRIAADTKLQELLKPDEYKQIGKARADLQMYFFALPLVLKREGWNIFWPVLRDEAEAMANSILDVSEKKDRAPSIFGD